MNDYRPGAHSRCLADGPVNPETGAAPVCFRPINHPGEHGSSSGTTTWHACEPNHAGTACRHCGAPAEPVSPDELVTALAATPDPDATPCPDCGGGLAHFPECVANTGRHIPDALNLCNGCDTNAADPDSAAGYCRDCEASAVR